MDSKLAEKIERFEAQLPRWEKWLLICYGVTFTFFITAIIRGVEHVYLVKAFSYAMPAEGGSFFNDPIAMNIQRALFAPWWILAFWIILLAMLFPGVLLSIHPTWRKVPLAKRFNLIFSYFISAWVVFLSIGAENPTNAAPDGYIFLLVASAIAIGTGYWQLRRKRDKAEEVFP